ncbi:putative leucine-rich repeat receptor-like protein kinase At2g19210 [Phragmites australis]|uniref:putative leucine-rich repeat receptor-like protein kinase At2g19210 n=1 Tax=Phragmites australis TaxID=29695 RepID=UPI002D79DC44|nr:putative leucine-rich repeat receptor-like protein kinase At2g19210 [Phragmites australis]XP_062198458.1 putative leucine-rich repeat receptor-like protein kinase At2g19210 [Phragmites australis]
MAIKFEYGMKKNWMGDPCSPTKYAWDSVKCNNTSDNSTRDLSNSYLNGVISKDFILLTALENLCYLTGRITKSSDVYSFGVVLLEVAMGETPLLPGHGHIVQRVKQKTATGDISSVADVRLRGAYDNSSMWKVVDTAMMCTVDSAAERPTMASVVVQLKESLALDETREKDSSLRASRGSDIAAMVSTFGSLAR